MSNEKIKKEYVERPTEELSSMLLHHLDALKELCVLYDKGKRHFSSEISINLRVLFSNNPKNNNVSLISQLGFENKSFYDTTKNILKNNEIEFDENLEEEFGVRPAGGLAIQTIINSLGEHIENWEPSLDFLNPSKSYKTNFKKWWTKEIIETNSGKKFSRFDLVSNMANQDRGGHVAENIEKFYYNLTRNSDYGYKTEIWQNNQFLKNVSRENSGLNLLRSLMRQIAHEVLMTLLIDKREYILNLPRSVLGTPQPLHILKYGEEGFIGEYFINFHP